MNVDVKRLRQLLSGFPASKAAAILDAVGIEVFEIADDGDSASRIPQHQQDSTVHSSLSDHSLEK
jgi:hypothetical protein